MSLIVEVAGALIVGSIAFLASLLVFGYVWLVGKEAYEACDYWLDGRRDHRKAKEHYNSPRQRELRIDKLEQQLGMQEHWRK